MKKELTNEVLEAMKKCDLDCASCDAIGVCDKYGLREMMKALAAVLIEERAKPKDDVWKNAPDWATIGRVYWESYAQAKTKRITGPIFTRELPKTRARQIAEQEGYGLAEKYGWNASAKELVTNVMESALNKYAEELENESEVL